MRDNDSELTLPALAQCVMKAVLEADLPEVLSWATDSRLPIQVRIGYVFDLERFARKPGLAREALIRMVNDSELGGAAVRALAGALKAQALPLLHEVRQSAPHDMVRDAARAVIKKIEARSRRVDLPIATPAMLPQGYAATSIEFDTDCIPRLLSILEQELNGQLKPGIAQQLALSANQLKRGRGRFYIVPLQLSDGVMSQLGFGLYAEDEDVTVVEIHFEGKLRDGIDAALSRVMESDA